jgi:hypothetical protein
MTCRTHITLDDGASWKQKVKSEKCFPRDSKRKEKMLIPLHPDHSPILQSNTKLGQFLVQLSVWYSVGILKTGYPAYKL